MAGRPKAIIDWNKVDKMLQAHCDGVGIAGLLGVDYKTLTERCMEDKKLHFSEYRQLKQSEGKELLRQKMFGQAMSGDKTLQIWLSKQYLGMKEHPDKKEEEKEQVIDLSKLPMDLLLKVREHINADS